MPPHHLADSADLQQWANKIEARHIMPELIRRLVLATSEPTYIDFRAQEGTGYGGWDGHVVTPIGSTYVPEGTSGWEMGVGAKPSSKANDDYKKRTEQPNPFDPTQTTFVFCTPRRWAGKNKWVQSRQREGKWKEVRAYDADDLATWLTSAPSVHVWFSLLIGKPVNHVQDLASWWKSWSTITSPPISPKFILSGRSAAVEQLLTRLAAAPSIITVQSQSVEEALAVIAAAIESAPTSRRDTLQTCTLLIDDRTAWRYFASQTRPLILIPRFVDPPLINQALQAGHHVIVPVGADHRLPATIEVPRLSAVEARSVLESEALSPPLARHLSALARRSLSAYRRLRATTPLETPLWAQGEHGPAMLALVLAGEWDESSEGDREVLERLANRPYKEIKALLQCWRNTPDAPFRLVKSHWRINAKEDSWRLLAEYATAEDLRAFVSIAVEVLTERNPRRDLNPEDQLVADFKGVRRRYSDELRSGLADSLAMLGALDSPEASVATGDGSDTAAFAQWGVRDLMVVTTETRELWLDLATHLPALAEAAPDTFLGALEQDLALDTPTLLTLFEPQPGFLSPNYEYPHLLWALEQLAWSPIYFPRVALILAKLSAIAPETKIVNNPEETLVSFFRLWLPQCGAPADLRLRVLDQIRSRMPNVGWQLLVRLLPSGYDSASILSGPGGRAVLWREWPSEATRPSLLERIQAFREISKRLVEDVSVNPVRWLTLIDHLHHLDTAVLDEALAKLQMLPESVNDADLQAKLWMKLRNLISRHRAYRNADWAMPENLLDRLETICHGLEPDDPAIRHQWLFEHQPQFDSKFKSYRDQLAECERRRTSAIKEILDVGGLGSVLTFAESVESPSDVGSALFMASSDGDIFEEMIASLGQPGTAKLVAQGFFWKAIREGGEAWIRQHLSKDRLDKLAPEVRSSILLCFSLEKSTLDLVESFDEKTQRLFWRGIGSYWPYNQDVFSRSIENLIRYDRPRLALHLLATRSRDRNYQLDIELVEKALIQSMQVSLEDDSTRISQYDAEQLLKYLLEGDADKTILEQLEWLYLPLLDPDHTSLRLHDRLSNDPAFFVEVVRLRFKPDKQTELFSVDPEDAKRAYHLLYSWRNVPGMQGDGTLDESYLAEWVHQVRALAEESGLKKEASLAIGQMLRWGPEEKEGVWPAPAICDILQQLSSDIVDEGFLTAIYNSRGTTSRGPFEGGIQERQLADRYESYASKLDAQWPRVAAILRQLAAGYRSEGKIHDQEAEKGEDELG